METIVVNVVGRPSPSGHVAFPGCPRLSLAVPSCPRLSPAVMPSEPPVSPDCWWLLGIQGAQGRHPRHSTNLAVRRASAHRLLCSRPGPGEPASSPATWHSLACSVSAASAGCVPCHEKHCRDPVRTLGSIVKHRPGPGVKSKQRERTKGRAPSVPDAGPQVP